jgi:hypothetical protein
LFRRTSWGNFYRRVAASTRAKNERSGADGRNNDAGSRRAPRRPRVNLPLLPCVAVGVSISVKGAVPYCRQATLRAVIALARGDVRLEGGSGSGGKPASPRALIRERRDRAIVAASTGHPHPTPGRAHSRGLRSRAVSLLTALARERVRRGSPGAHPFDAGEWSRAPETNRGWTVVAAACRQCHYHRAALRRSGGTNYPTARSIR